jgi:carbon-monoxide dehydrogenase small subunit
MTMSEACKNAIPVTMSVNGRVYTRDVEPRLLLSDFLRQELGLTGTHVGCEHGKCGACTVLVGGRAVRACLMFAVQAEGASIETIEGLASGPDRLHPIQRAFIACHGLQCGFCTPGMVNSTRELLAANPAPTDQEIREALAGNICRCTGYTNIVKAVRQAAEEMRAIEPREARGG